MRVVNKYKESFDIYIGRGSIWGNPFEVKDYGRDLCIDMYRSYILDKFKKDKNLVKKFLDMEDKTLGCFCKPQRCHGDILLEILSDLKRGVDIENM